MKLKARVTSPGVLRYLIRYSDTAITFSRLCIFPISLLSTSHIELQLRFPLQQYSTVPRRCPPPRLPRSCFVLKGRFKLVSCAKRLSHYLCRQLTVCVETFVLVTLVGRKRNSVGRMDKGERRKVFACARVCMCVCVKGASFPPGKYFHYLRPFVRFNAREGER